jgi:uncharacterized protein (DUF58 family)
LDTEPHPGQGEDILGIREYGPGDSPSRVHWRSSARRDRLHVLQLNRSIQSELAVMLDLTRRSRYGTGAEATTELAIAAATSVLARGFEARHRLSLAYVQHQPVFFPAGAGLAHLHLLLDRLAVLNAQGEGDFWANAGTHAARLRPGSRAVFIATTANTPVEPTAGLIRQLVQLHIGVDMVLIDESGFIKIYRDQESDLTRSGPGFARQVEILRLNGARVLPLSRSCTRLAQGGDPAGAVRSSIVAANRVAVG